MIEKNNDSILGKICPSSLLENIFDYLPKKRKISIVYVNKNLSNIIHYKIDDYYVPKQYQEVIINSKGDINNIFHNCYNIFRENSSGFISYNDMISSIIKYMKYLFKKRKIKDYFFDLDLANVSDFSYIRFMLDILRKLKVGITISLKLTNRNNRFYDIFKDSIQNIEELNTIIIPYMGKRSYNTLDEYWELFNWNKTLINTINLSYINNKTVNPFSLMESIPKVAKFKNVILDGEICTSKITQFFSLHCDHIESIEIDMLNDGIFSSNDINYSVSPFSALNKLKNIKLKNCKHITFFSFLKFFNNSLSSIRALTLDNLSHDSDNNDYNTIILLLQALSSLEELEINFNDSIIFNKEDLTLKILNYIIYNNKKINKLKLNINFGAKNELLNNSKNSCFFNFDSLVDNDSKKLIRHKEFSELLSNISKLTLLSKFILSSPMDSKLTETFNNYFNVGNNLKELKIIHHESLNTELLFTNHPSLVKINLELFIDKNRLEIQKGMKENDINMLMKNEIVKYKFILPKRTWKDIQLNYYPINDDTIQVLVESAESIEHLVLNKTINISEKTDKEVFRILSSIIQNNK